MINRYNYLLFQVIKGTYLEVSLLFMLVQIINIDKVIFLYIFNFSNGASFSQPNKFISVPISYLSEALPSLSIKSCLLIEEMHFASSVLVYIPLYKKVILQHQNVIKHEIFVRLFL